MSTTQCFYCTGTGAIEVNDDFERTCGQCGGTGLDGNTLRAAAPELLEVVRLVVQAREEADEAGDYYVELSSYVTDAARAAIAKATAGGN